MKRLESHDAIALDFDETLVNGRKSYLLWNFIRKNPDKKFWIVSFRTGNLAEPHVIWTELYVCSGLRPEYFEGIRTIKEETYLKAIIYKFITDINDYIEWKGKTCKELGCTILVDDMPSMVKYGCEIHGVEFVDSRTLE